MEQAGKTILRWLGLDKQSDYVRRYFYLENMRASIYMSVVVIVLEVWMIFRMIRTVTVQHITGDALLSIGDRYFSNYFVLLSAGILMLLYALRSTRGWTNPRWVSIAVIVFCIGVCIYELWYIVTRDPVKLSFNIIYNALVVTAASLLMILFSVVLLRNNGDRKWQSMFMLYLFSFVCINFGMTLSVNAYSKGEQILTFLTMALYVVCLLTWRPIVGFTVLTVSYLIFFGELNALVPVNSPDGLPGITESTMINGFTMWLSTLLFCISNYSKTRSQALKDENLEQINAHLSEISVKDELTGIHNMFYFRTEAEKLLNYVTTDRENAVYLFLDLENFKSYNEKYGFHEGNALLCRIADTIQKAFKGSLVSRFSDDHFVVLTKKEGCEAIVAQISEEIRKNQREVQLSLKCGAYQPGEGETDPSLACDRARFACNSIKKHYDRSFRYYDKSMEDQFSLKTYIVNHIDSAIENGDIRVYYQPVVSTKTGQICGLEALARWNDPTHGLLPPGAFISILEEHRQIHKLDRCIVEQVCRDYRDACDRHEPFAPVSINFSRLDFELCDIIGYLNEMSKRYGVPKHYLDIEITESALSDEKSFLPGAIQNLREMGYHVWLDDFGSGYSSLNVLKDYQFDVLKIDMKFLAGFGKNEKTMPILNNIIDLTKQLKMVSLTEGVETQEQYRFLQSIGCDRAQGYLFGKPATLENLRARIRAGEITVSPEYLTGEQTA